ncbi:MAG TPA: hypothetical protein VK116_04765, partial [Planctomycetota bacterium]|nr:hypothetical protein [Planctomycetota bacterium]
MARDDLAAKERELALLEETRDAGGNERELLLALDATEARRRDLADKLAFIEKAWDDAIARAQTLERDLAMLGSTLMGSSPRGNSGSSAIDSPDLLALGGPIADPEIALRLRRLRQLEARLVARAQAEADARPSAFRPEGSRAAAESPDDHSLYRDDPSGLWAEVVGLVTERIANLVYGGARWDAFDGLVLCLLILTFIMSVWLAGEPVRWVTRRRLERELEILRRRARELERRYSELGIDHRLLASGEEESGESNAPRLTPVFVPLPAAPREPSPEESASQAYSEALDRALPDDVSSEDQAAATRDAQGTDEDATRVAPGAPHAHALHATPAEPHPRAFRAAPAESLATSPIEEGALPSPITNADAPDQTDGVESATEITPASALPLDIGAHADGASSEGADAADAEISGARFTTTDLSGPIEAFGIDAPRPDTPIILVDAAWPESSKARAFASFDGEGIEPVPPSADSVPIILGATFS